MTVTQANDSANQVPFSAQEYIDQINYYSNRCSMLRAQIEIRDNMIKELEKKIKELDTAAK